MATDRAANILAELTDEEAEIVEEYINENDEKDENNSDAKLTFEEFLQLMKENETMKKLIKNIANQKQPKQR